MKIVLADGIHGKRGFYKVVNPTRRAYDFILYNIPEFSRFWEDGYWHVHKEYTQWLTSTNKDITKIKYDYELFHLLPTAPMAIVDGAWRYFAKKYHPDKGGDEDLYKMYSAAYQRIKESSNEHTDSVERTKTEISKTKHTIRGTKGKDST